MAAVRDSSSSKQVIWQVWEDFTFAHEKEFWECHTFPMPEMLLSHTSVALSDSIQLSIQLQTPVAGPFPTLQHKKNVPRQAMILGMDVYYTGRSC